MGGRDWRRWAVTALMLAVAGVAASQVALSRLGHLSYWKGGGFGMYTEPHPNYRTVWAALDETRALRLAPPAPADPAVLGPLSPAERARLAEARAMADDLRFYPRAGLAERIRARLAGLPWIDPPEGGPRLAVHEFRHDIQGERATARRLALYPEGGE